MRSLCHNSRLTPIIFGLLLVIFIPSCKKEVSNNQIIAVNPEFLIDGKLVSSYGIDYAPDELSSNLDDSSKVVKVQIGTPVYFEDITELDSVAVSKKWYIDEKEWKDLKERKKADGNQYSYTFNNSKFHKISLIYGGHSAVEKMIQVVSQNMEANQAIEKNFKKRMTSNSYTSKGSFPKTFNASLFLSKLFEENIGRKRQESLYDLYLDSLDYYVTAETVVSIDGIQDDLNDAITMAMITGDKLKLEEEPVYNDGKISYIAITKDK